MGTQEKAVAWTLGVVALVVCGLAVAAGMAANSLWVGLLALGGLVVLVKAWNDGTDLNYRAFLVSSLIGLALFGGATWLGHLAGRWLWTPLWLFVALIFGHAGIFIRNEGKEGPGNVTMTVGALCGLFAVGGPWLLYGAQPAAAPAWPTLALPVRPSSSGGWQGIVAFLNATLTSFWGVLYLLSLLVVAQFWVKKWGALLASAGLLLTVGVAGSVALTRAFTSSPATLMTDLLTYAGQRSGTAGWGAVLAGVAVAVGLYPLLRESLRYSAMLAEALARRRLEGATGAMRYLQERGGASPRTVLAALVLMATHLSLAVAIWVALRRMAAAGAPTAFLLLGLPDLAVPHWRPVGQPTYFVLPVLLGVASLVHSRITQSRGLAVPIFQHPVALIAGSLLIGLVAPAGVMLYLLAESVAQSLGTLLALRGLRPAPRREPKPMARPPIRVARPPRPAPPAHLTPRTPPRGSPITPGDSPRSPAPSAHLPAAGPPPTAVRETPAMAQPTAAPPAPALAGTLLFTHSRPIVDCALTEAGNLVILDSDGRVLCAQGRQPEDVARLDLARPLGLTCLPEAKLAAVDGTGSIAVMASPAAGALTPEHQRASTPISSYAVNPFGTLLALAAPSAHQVTLFFLASGKEQPLADDLGELSALAYSGDGRYLAAGNHAGEIHILDMAHRQRVATLRPQTFEPESVVAVCPGLEGGWVAAYESHDLACWTSAGELHASKKAPSAIACLAAEPASGKIAFGNQRGYVRVYARDLGQAVFAGQVHPKGVVRLAFVDEGRALISAAKDGSVRRIALEAGRR